MIITRDNYEAFFLDYLEGNLDVALLPEFEAFVAANPDLKEELESVGSFKLEPTPTLTFDHKVMLYKGQEFLYWNLLPGYGVRPYKAPSSSVWKGVKSAGTLPRLVAPQIICDFKDSLRQKEAGALVAGGAKIISLKRAFYYSAAAAAIAALLWMNGTSEDPQPAQMAQDKQRPTEQEVKPSSSGNNQDSLDVNQPNGVPSEQESTTPLYRVMPTPEDDFGDVAQDIPQPIIEERNDSIENTPAPVQAPSIQQAPEEEYAESNTPQPVLPSNPNRITMPSTYSEGGNDNGLMNASASKKAKNYNNIWAFAEDKAKSKLWGSEEYPENNFALALAEKQLHQPAKKKDPKIVIQSFNNGDEKYLRIKLGKFETIRKR